jgi:hypothetical protein
MEKTTKLYVSPKREENEENYGYLAETCVCCSRPLNSETCDRVHMNEHWLAVNIAIEEENCFQETGANTQGFFYIGKECAKKMPKEFIHKNPKKKKK